MVSHVDDASANGTRILSRDCAVYRLTTPRGATLHVAVNHFKSKGYGNPAASNARRKAQAERVAAICHDIVTADPDALVAVVGNLNDYPDSTPLAPPAATNLRDVSTIAGFADGGYDSSGAHNKIDCILCSPKLFQAVIAGGIWRKGV